MSVLIGGELSNEMPLSSLQGSSSTVENYRGNTNTSCAATNVMLLHTKMLHPVLTPDVCASLALEQFGTQGCKNKTTTALDDETCTSLIGASCEVCAELWNLIDPKNNENSTLLGAHPKHLFWGLLLLKACYIEAILIRVVGGVDAGSRRIQ